MNKTFRAKGSFPEGLWEIMSVEQDSEMMKSAVFSGCKADFVAVILVNWCNY
jgi:hypothetical protein